MDGEAERDERNDLDCVICGRWFPTFERLATHMAARHGPPTPSAPVYVELPALTGRQKASFPERQNRPMAKKKTASKATERKAGGALPAPAESESQTDLNAFLKADDIGDVDDSKTVKLTGVVRGPQAGTFGEEVIVEVRVGRETKDWSVRTDSPNYRMLIERFGNRPPKGWSGKSVDVTIRMSRQDRAYIAIDRV